MIYLGVRLLGLSDVYDFEGLPCHRLYAGESQPARKAGL